MKAPLAKLILTHGLLLSCLPGCILMSPLRPSIFPEAPPVVQATLGVPSLQHKPEAQAKGANDPSLALQACMNSERISPFKDNNTLTEQGLVEQVVARNPTVAQMTAAWQG